MPELLEDLAQKVRLLRKDFDVIVLPTPDNPDVNPIVFPVDLDASGAIISPARIGAPKLAQHAMRAFNIALAHSLTSSTPVVEAVVGDSLVTYFVADPFESPWVAVYEKEMARRFNTRERTKGYVPVLQAVDFYPHQCRFDHYNGGSIDSVPQNTTGPADNGGTLGSGDTLDVTGDGDGVIVYFSTRSSGGGTADIQVDGPGGTTTVSVDTTVGAVAVDCSALVESIAAPNDVYGPLTVTITQTGGTNVDVDGIYFCASNRTSGYQLHRIDHGGYKLADFVFSTNFTRYLTNVQPDLVTILLGTNDYVHDAVTSSMFAARLAALIAVIRLQYTVPPAIRFIFEHGVDATADAPGGWSTEYRAAARTVCEADGDVAFVDFHEVIGDYSAGSDPYGLAPADHLHPNEKAHRALGLAVAAHTLAGTPTAAQIGQRLTDISSPTLAGGGKFRIADLDGMGSTGLVVYGNAADTQPQISVGTIFGSAPVIGFGPGGSTATDISLLRSNIGVLKLADATAAHGAVLMSVNAFGAGFSLLANATDTQPSIQLTTSSLKFGPGGSTAPDILVARTATGVLQGTDGTHGHGAFLLSVNAFGSAMSILADSGDSQPSLQLVGSALKLGPGGSTAPDVTFARTSATTATLTGALAVYDGTGAHGVVTSGGSGSGPIVGLYGNITDTQPEVGLAADGLRIGPGGSTATDVSFLRTAAATATLTATYFVEDGTAGHGRISLGATAFGPVVGIYGSTADTQPKIGMSGTNLTFGPGGSTATDISFSRTGSAACQITGQLTITTGLTIADAKNIVVGGTTGTKIGTSATAQKLGFFNATPVVQPTSANEATVGTTAPAGGTGTAAGGWDTAGHRDTAITTINSCVTLVNQLRADLVALGLIKGS